MQPIHEQPQACSDQGWLALRSCCRAGTWTIRTHARTHANRNTHTHPWFHAAPHVQRDCTSVGRACLGSDEALFIAVQCS